MTTDRKHMIVGFSAMGMACVGLIWGVVRPEVLAPLATALVGLALGCAVGAFVSLAMLEMIEGWRNRRYCKRLQDQAALDREDRGPGMCKEKE